MDKLIIKASIEWLFTEGLTYSHSEGDKVYAQLNINSHAIELSEEQVLRNASRYAQRIQDKILKHKR